MCLLTTLIRRLFVAFDEPSNGCYQHIKPSAFGQKLIDELTAWNLLG